MSAYRGPLTVPDLLRRLCAGGVFLFAMLALGGPLAAQTAESPGEPMALASLSAPEKTVLGPVTKQPLPRFVSMKADEGNVRRGPSLAHRIDWVFQRRDMPLQIVAEYGNWRQVRDRDGAGGWMHHMLLSRVRTVIVQEDLVALQTRPESDAPIQARAEAGVIARLGDCEAEWCRIHVGRQGGWVRKSALWGVDAAEIRD